jgi:hypothetical protein
MRELFATVCVSAGVVLAPVDGRTAPAQDEELCMAGPPSLSVALEVSERAVLYLVTAAVVDPDTLPKDQIDLVRGTFELTPIATLKGPELGGRVSVSFDATLYPDIFGRQPCRWSPLPEKGQIWIATGSLDGDNCAQCDGRMDALHKIGWRAPLTRFLR